MNKTIHRKFHVPDKTLAAIVPDSMYAKYKTLRDNLRLIAQGAKAEVLRCLPIAPFYEQYGAQDPKIVPINQCIAWVLLQNAMNRAIRRKRQPETRRIALLVLAGKELEARPGEFYVFPRGFKPKDHYYLRNYAIRDYERHWEKLEDAKEERVLPSS